jgi:drug/metabolite transporter (DMT)-like permease
MTRDWQRWGAFFALSIIWGSSFLWAKIALREIGPFMIVSLRFLFSTIVLVALMRASKLSFPRDARTWGNFAILSFVYSTLPVWLSTWATTRIDSSLGAVLNALAPLFTVVVAGFILHDEPTNTAKLIGTIIGFVGAVVLVVRDFNSTGNSDLVGVLAQLGSSLCYALSAVMARKLLLKQHTFVQAAASVLLADITMWMVTPFIEPIIIPTQWVTWLGVLWLGVLASAVGNAFYFELLKGWGASRTAMVSYLIPVVGLVLGIVVLHETLYWERIVGAFLILLGVYVASNGDKFFAKKSASLLR